MLQPSAASARAMAWPMPPFEPVMSAQRPFSMPLLRNPMSLKQRASLAENLGRRLPCQVGIDDVGVLRRLGLLIEHAHEGEGLLELGRRDLERFRQALD